MIGSIMGAEMAYHNGMTRVFEITDAPGTDPALLRTYKRAITSRTERDNQPANTTGHPAIGYMPEMLPGYRRYADATLENAIPQILNYTGPNKSDVDTYTQGFDVPRAVLIFFQYPRHTVFPRAAKKMGSRMAPR
jgi:hypothetical protein